MKKAIIIIAVTAVIFSGCGPSKAMLRIKSMKKVALVSVAVTNEIQRPEDQKEETGLSALKATIKTTKALVKDGLDAAVDAMAHRMHAVAAETPAQVMNNVQTTGVFSLIPEDEVLNNEIYSSLSTPDKGLDWNGNATPFLTKEGWRVINPEYLAKDKKLIEIAKGLGVDAVLIVEITCSWGVYSGVGATGKAKGYVDFSTRLIGPEGDEVWSSSVSGIDCGETTGMISGVYKEEEMEKLLVKAVNIAAKEVFSDLRKALDKLEESGKSS